MKKLFFVLLLSLSLICLLGFTACSSCASCSNGVEQNIENDKDKEPSGNIDKSNTAPHTHEYDDGVIYDADCTEQGYALYTCKVCGESYKDNYTKSLGHEYIDSITLSTCKEEGYTTHTCSRCNDTYKDGITAKLAHDYVASGEITAYCVLSVKQAYVCSVCGDEKYEKIENYASCNLPDTHKNLKYNEVCEYCGYKVCLQDGDSVLMGKYEDDTWKYSSEHYGTETHLPAELNYYRDEVVHAYIADGCQQITGGFGYCKNLTSIIIPDTVYKINRYAFYACYKLNNVNIPNGVTIIDSYAFSSCESLESIIIPDSVTKIGSSAFYGCDSLTNVVIPDSVKDLGYNTFDSCNNLESITLSANLTEIGNSIISNCTKLTDIYYNRTINEWKALKKADYWHYNVPATVVICTDGKVKIDG